MEPSVQILKALEKLKASSSAPNDLGICGYILNEGCVIQGNLLLNLFEKWPLFSGSFSYPVKGYGDLTARDAYWEGESSWDKNSEYGSARWSLVDFLIKELRIYSGEAATKVREFKREIKEGLSSLSERGYTLSITDSSDSTEFNLVGAKYRHYFSVNHQEISSVMQDIETFAQHHIDEAFIELNSMGRFDEEPFRVFKDTLLKELEELTKRGYTLKLEEVDIRCTKLVVCGQKRELVHVLHSDMVLCASQDPVTIAESYGRRTILDFNTREEQYNGKV